MQTRQDTGARFFIIELKLPANLSKTFKFALLLSNQRKEVSLLFIATLGPVFHSLSRVRGIPGIRKLCFVERIRNVLGCLAQAQPRLAKDVNGSDCLRHNEAPG